MRHSSPSHSRCRLKIGRRSLGSVKHAVETAAAILERLAVPVRRKVELEPDRRCLRVHRRDLADQAAGVRQGARAVGGADQRRRVDPRATVRQGGALAQPASRPAAKAEIEQARRMILPECACATILSHPFIHRRLRNETDPRPACRARFRPRRVASPLGSFGARRRVAEQVFERKPGLGSIDIEIPVDRDNCLDPEAGTRFGERCVGEVER